MTPEGRIPREEWRTIVRNVPLVAVDMVIQREGGVVLGKRTNNPAKGAWFVPGGRVRKQERLVDAVHRVAEEEVGIDVTIDRQLGVYEHFYDDAEMADVDEKHYVPIGFLVTTTDSNLTTDGQHAGFATFRPPFDDIEVHPYVRTYLDDAGILPAVDRDGS